MWSHLFGPLEYPAMGTNKRVPVCGEGPEENRVPSILRLYAPSELELLHICYLVAWPSSDWLRSNDRPQTADVMYFKKNLVQNYIWVPIKRPLKICQVFRNLEEPGYREEASGLAPGFFDQIIDNQFELNCTGSHTYTLFCKRRTRMDFSENTLDFLFLIISFSTDTL